MRDPETLLKLIAARLSEVNTEIGIHGAMYEGSADLIRQDLIAAFQSNGQEELIRVSIELAEVAQAGGYNRGRFELIRDLFEMIQQWEAGSNWGSI